MPELQRLLTQARRISEHRTKEAEGEIRRVYQNLLKDLRAFVAGGTSGLPWMTGWISPYFSKKGSSPGFWRKPKRS